MTQKTGNRRSLRGDLRILLRGVGWVHRTAPRLLPFGITKAAFAELKPFVSLIFTSRILELLLTGAELSAIAWNTAALLGLNLLLESLSTWAGGLRDVQILSMNRRQEMVLNRKLQEMDYQTAEDPRTHELRQQINDRCMYMGRNLWAVEEMLEALVSGIVAVTASIGITVGLFLPSAQPLSPLAARVDSPLLSAALIVLILLCAALSVHLSLRQNRRVFELSDDTAFNRENRVYDHYQSYLEDHTTGKDVRLFRQRELIEAEARRAMKLIEAKLLQLGRCEGLHSALNTALSAMVSGIICLYVGLKALAGLVSVGNIVRYTGGVLRFFTGISLLLRQLADLRMMSRDFEFFFDYLDMEGVQPCGERSITGKAHTVEFRNVSFRYPGTQSWALREVSFTLTAGEHLAVVGANGSGKTTMIKLLCRLYDPTEGVILLDGVDIREYDREQYQQLFGVIFQDFRLFALPIAENITAGGHRDDARLHRVLELAGLWERVERMENGVDTPIYKEYYENGVEISGGEAQKLAIARALYRRSELIILDEPTAALDPVSEYEIYARFNALVQDRTAVYITHRLASCRFCSRILVFDEGRLLQSGSHEALLQDTAGKYHALWHAQAQYYTDPAPAASG